MCLAVLLCEQYFCRFANGSAKISISLTSVYSAALRCWAKLLPFGVNCRLQLAGLGKKREETVKPTFSVSLLYVESDFGTTDATDKSSPVEALNLIVDSKSQPVELDNSTIELHVLSRRKKSLQSYCSVDFDFLALMAIL